MSDKTFSDFGTLIIDCSAIEPFAVDLPPGARVGLLSEQPGCELAITETLANQAEHGGRAGVTDADIRTIETARKRLALIDEHLPALRKLLEVVEETRAVVDDELQRQLFAIASAVENRARMRGNADLLAKYENVRKYRSARALESARTRRRNEAAQQEPVAETGE